MGKKLTLHIDDSVLHKAFYYAENQGLDLSTVVESFLRKFVVSSHKDTVKNFPISDKVRSLSGRLKVKGDNVDWENEKNSYFEEKYGL